MKTFLSLIMAIFLFSNFALSQDKFQPLAENASLEETQAWLKKAVKKFSPNDVYNLKFKGCSLKVHGSSVYISSGTSTTNNSTPAFIEGDFAYLSKSSLSSAGGGYIFPSFWKYTLELKEMNAENILLKSARTENEQTIYLNPVGQKKSVNYRNFRNYFRNTSLQNYATFTVKKEYAGQIKTAFAQAIKLCREPN